MARARNIKPGFFTNEFLAFLPFETRLLFIGLWTLADRDGRLEDRPARIKAELFPFDTISVQRVDEMLSELAILSAPYQDHPFIIRYYHGGINRYIQIVAFDKNQNPHKLEKPSAIPPYVDSSANDAPDNQPETKSKHRTLVQNSIENTEQAPCKGVENGHPIGLIPDSLIPDSLIPDSLIPDSLQQPNGCFHPTVAAPHLGGGSCQLAEIQFPISGGKTCHLPRDRLERYQKTYGDRLDVGHVLQKAVLWLEANPKKQPRNQSGIVKFLTQWLGREDERERKAIASNRNGISYSTPLPDDF